MPLAAQFSISNLCLLLAYPAAGWLGVTVGLRPTAVILGLIGKKSVSRVKGKPERTITNAQQTIEAVKPNGG